MTAALSRSTTRSEATAGMPSPAPGLRLIGASCLGLLVVQLAWLLAVPAFGGMDEFDHVYKAAAVARGDWVAEPASATRGTGAWVEVPTDIVKAAHDECEYLTYTEPGDCVGTPASDGTTRVASGAGRYNPLYYVIVGYPSLPFEGRAAVYAMRAASMAACTGLFFLALISLRRWVDGTWPYVGAVVACTPVVLYSGAVVAPNGLEIVAGLAFWCAVLGLLRAAESAPPDRVLLGAGVVSGSVLLLTRSLGPLWAALIVVTAMVSAPGAWRRVGGMLRYWSGRVAMAILAVVGVASVVWIRSMGSLTIGVRDTMDLSASEKLAKVLELLPLWLLQSVAAFPYRNQASLPVVYACYLAVGLFLLVLALRHGSRSRAALVLCAAASALVPAAIVFATMDTFYAAWQGRYALPYSLGILVMAGVALERHPARPGWRLLLPGVALLSVALTAAVLEVLRLQQVQPSAVTGVWDAPPAWLVATVMVIGTTLMCAVAIPSRPLVSRGVDP